MAHYFETGLMVGQSAWHGLGKVIGADDERRFSVVDSIGLSGLDWTVELADCYYLYGEQGEHCDKLLDAYVTVRKHRDGRIDPLGVVGSKYHPLQNVEAFEWFQPWLDTKEVSIETAGALKGGRLVWVLARILRGNLDVGGGDEIAKYLMISTSHDGTQATRVGFTPIRVVCWNTLSAAHADNASRLLRVKHTKGQNDTLSTIRETIDLVDQQFNATADQYRRLMESSISLRDLRTYVKLVNGIDPETPEKAIGKKISKRIDRMVQMAVSGLGQSPDDMTYWSAYNGVTQYLSHEYGSDNEKRALSMMQGTAADMNSTALELALELAS